MFLVQSIKLDYEEEEEKEIHRMLALLQNLLKNFALIEITGKNVNIR